MEKNLYSVFDSKAALFMAPFVAMSDGVAIRGFQDEANKQGTMMNRHPSDFALYRLGSFDEKTGRHTNLDIPTNLGQAAQYIDQVAKALPPQ